MGLMRRLWPTLRDFGLIALGALLQAFAVRLFLIPANLASGGVTGIAQIVARLFHPPVGIGFMVFLGNVPLFIIGWRYLGGPRFTLRTALAIVVCSFFTDFLTRFLPATGLTDDIVLNSLYGAIVSGIGYGLVYRAHGSSGGSDILVRILNHWSLNPDTHENSMTRRLQTEPIFPPPSAHHCLPDSATGIFRHVEFTDGIMFADGQLLDAAFFPWECDSNGSCGN
jgi:hypothetical protein